MRPGRQVGGPGSPLSCDGSQGAAQHGNASPLAGRPPAPRPVEMLETRLSKSLARSWMSASASRVRLMVHDFVPPAGYAEVATVGRQNTYRGLSSVCSASGLHRLTRDSASRLGPLITVAPTAATYALIARRNHMSRCPCRPATRNS